MIEHQINKTQQNCTSNSSRAIDYVLFTTMRTVKVRRLLKENKMMHTEPPEQQQHHYSICSWLQLAAVYKQANYNNVEGPHKYYIQLNRSGLWHPSVHKVSCPLGLLSSLLNSPSLTQIACLHILMHDWQPIGLSSFASNPIVASATIFISTTTIFYCQRIIIHNILTIFCSCLQTTLANDNRSTQMCSQVHSAHGS